MCMQNMNKIDMFEFCCKLFIASTIIGARTIRGTFGQTKWHVAGELKKKEGIGNDAYHYFLDNRVH